MSNTTVLICDDNVAVHESISAYLNEARIHSVSAYTGEEALEILQRSQISFVILDMMLPGKSGTEVLKELRKFSDVPVLCLSAKSSEFDRILGLELGADDYITKPFSPREVATRVQVILRRAGKTNSQKQIVFTNLAIDQNSYTASVNGQLLDLTPKELNILALFASNPGIVLSRERILNSVWGQNYYSDIRIIDTQIKRIRKKLPLDAGFEIRSIYGIGYKMEAK